LSSALHSRTRFLDGASLPEELACGRPTRLRRASRSPTTTASTARSSSRTRQVLRRCARSRRRGHAQRRLPRHAAGRVSARLRDLSRLLTAAHQGHAPARARDELLPPAEQSCGRAERRAVCLSGCARSGWRCTIQSSPTARARTGPDRFFVELQASVRARRRRRNTALRDLAETLDVETVVTGDSARAARSARRLAGRAVAIKTARPSTAVSASGRGNHESCCWRRGDARAVPRRSRRGRANRRARARARVRSDAGGSATAIPTSPASRPGDRPAADCLRRAFAERTPASTDTSAMHAPGSTRSCADRPARLAGFFSSTGKCWSSRREVAVDVRGESVARQALPPGRAEAARSDRSVCYLTGLSHVDPVEATSRSALPHEELVSCRHRPRLPRDIREKLIVPCREVRPEHAALVASFATYRSRGGSRTSARRSGCVRGPHRLARITDAGMRSACTTSSRHCRTRSASSLAPLAARSSSCASRSPACRATSRSIRGGMVISSRPLVELAPCSRARWPAARWCSGTRTRVRMRAS